jgi:catechol 2,3-dioxygenase-like lactoylglutathione lyase family enzyme
VHLGHLNLAVADLDRSARFYAEYFGFDRGSRRYPDGTVFLADAQGFDLALHQEAAVPAAALDGRVHFGFRASAEAVRELRRRLEAAGVAIVEAGDEAAYVGFKCLDPDGYVVEVYCEPDAAGAPAR